MQHIVNRLIQGQRRADVLKQQAGRCPVKQQVCPRTIPAQQNQAHIISAEPVGLLRRQSKVSAQHPGCPCYEQRPAPELLPYGQLSQLLYVLRDDVVCHESLSNVPIRPDPRKKSCAAPSDRRCRPA
ncbi:hypothetical protein SDC9_60625 [bioreactor metagenome]|uniref:Uncharacterized protein n=1 Tax=bioreactor metagenome TaxID=1076179 RepID=A0A644XJ68_9ZZZZ